MTLAQKLEEKGFKKGAQLKEREAEERRYEERKQSAIKMLDDGVDIRFISKYTDLSISEIEKLKEDVE